MNYYIFKNPYKKGDMPLEKLTYEPDDFMIGQKAVKYGTIIVISEKDWIIKKNIEKSY